MSGDQRVARGARSRRTITRHAVDVASVEGLSGLSFGRLATDLGLSKGGVATLFPTKEQLQVATAETAGELFLEAVVEPASSEPPGAARLRALLDRWIAYAEAPLFPGGCFWAASLPDFDSRPGPVRDLLARQRRAWLALLAEQVSRAGAAGEIAELDPGLAAFQLDALLNAANLAMRLGEPDVAARVRRAIDGLLAA
ncbi:TetR/AcrR family transcriptional regulator [Actinomadura sp. ATCC 31491]|uniref:TetR/AcrR family transcriptional regulator n=1 Tax=Actinomadura luzonensis TaxID=2805427 RepID=A0ABT0FJ77_9ACTN|nr:TetR/AcrR family transcriptional regulator [Actinomadura luzonensis]MCK2212351.1 TetR/AcrR family transcriptional regulator [Actinomadura luzonensis]